MMTAQDDLCFDCGIPMIVVNNPSEELVQSAGGFEQLRQAIIAFRGEYEEGTIDIAMCPGCNTTALLGPQVVVEGTVTEPPNDT